MLSRLTRVPPPTVSALIFAIRTNACEVVRDGRKVGTASAASRPHLFDISATRTSAASLGRASPPNLAPDLGAIFAGWLRALGPARLAQPRVRAERIC